MQKCKDKFQVLTLQLDPKVSEELQTKPEDAKRAELTAIWASDSAKDATVDKIRCAFTYDASYRDAPIPEEEPGQAAPYSPETVPPAAEGLAGRLQDSGVVGARSERRRARRAGGASSQPPARWEPSRQSSRTWMARSRSPRCVSSWRRRRRPVRGFSSGPWRPPRRCIVSRRSSSR